MSLFTSSARRFTKWKSVSESLNRGTGVSDAILSIMSLKWASKEFTRRSNRGSWPSHCVSSLPAEEDAGDGGSWIFGFEVEGRLLNLLWRFRDLLSLVDMMTEVSGVIVAVKVSMY